MARGAPEGIGPIGDLAPYARPMHGRIVGLVPALRVLGGLAGPLAQARVNARQKAKDYNDAETTTMAGQSGGRPVKTQPQGPSAEAEEAEYARAKQAGRENRAGYRRTMGTPTRPPRQAWGGEAPFSEEYEGKHFQKPPRKTMDTSNMRDWTP